MNRRRLALLICLFVISALLLASCKPEEATTAAPGSTKTSGDSVIAATATSAPEATAEPTKVESSDDDETDTPSLADVPGYTAMFVTEYGGQDAEGYNATTTMSYVADPLAWSMTIESADGVTTEMRYVDDTMYTQAGGMWTAMILSPEDAQDYTGLLLEDDFNADEMDDACDDMGKEVINGFSTRHYYCDSGMLEDLAATAEDMEDYDDGTELKEGSYDIWYSDEYGIVIKLSMTMVYEDADEGDFTWTYTQEILEISDDIEIEIPEDVGEVYDFSGQVSEDFELPVMDGATDFYSMMGISGYSVSATVDEVVEFYMDNMDSAGWTYDEDGSMPDYYSYNWTKGSETVNLIVSEDSGMSSVMLMQTDAEG